jgi:LuxR family transcriptional regulator, quorum-sensing system regulator RaiR
MDEQVYRLVMSRPIPEALIRALELAPDVPEYDITSWAEAHLLPRTGRDMRRPRPPGPVLTKQQERVLILASNGFRRKQTAQAMGIGEETVRNHLARARFRLKATNTTHAVAIAIRRGLIA